jgi:hypothetical protein
METALAASLGYPPATAPKFLHLWHFYCSYWLDFGELLTTMERRGMPVDREHLRQAEVGAEGCWALGWEVGYGEEFDVLKGT